MKYREKLYARAGVSEESQEIVEAWRNKDESKYKFYKSVCGGFYVIKDEYEKFLLVDNVPTTQDMGLILDHQRWEKI